MLQNFYENLEGKSLEHFEIQCTHLKCYVRTVVYYSSILILVKIESNNYTESYGIHQL